MSLFRDRRFALLVFGQTVNAIGTWCALVAVWGFASFRFDAGATELALLGLAWAVPPVLLGAVAGIPADRLGPKRVIVVADVVAAAVALLFIFADSFAALLVLAAAEGATKAFSEPAFQALPPRIVSDEQLPAANSILATATQSSIAFGPLLAAGAIALVGIEGAFVVNAATYLVGVAVLVPFTIGPARPGEARPRVIGEIRDAWRVIVERPELTRLLALAASVYVVWGAFIVIEPIYVREILHGDETLFALMQTTFGVGLVVTGIVVARLGERVVRWSVLCAAVVGSGVAAVVYVGTATAPVAFVGLLVWGVATALLIAPLRTFMQRAAPVESHGRVFAFDGMVHSTGDLVSLPLIGLAAGAFGVQLAAVAVAAVPVTGGFLAWRAAQRRSVAGDLGSDLRGELEPATV